jgi:diacylglycerol kinase (ATP)
MSGIGVVVNPRAGRNRGVHRTGRLEDLLGTAGWVRESASLEHLADIAAECRARAVDLLGVCGGDGTLARTLSALVRAYDGETLPRIVPLRAGTMNTVARAMGCPAWQPERMLAEIVATYRAGHSLDAAEHQLLCVNRRDYGFMVGAGVPVAFLRRYYEEPDPGSAAAARVLMRGIASVIGRGPLGRSLFAPLDARVEADGVALPFSQYSVIYASTIEEIGLGFRPTFRARERRGAFQVFAARIGAREFVRRLPRIWRGRPTRSPDVCDPLVCALGVEFPHPTPYMIDGDIMEPEAHLRVQIGPVIRVVRR